MTLDQLNIYVTRRIAAIRGGYATGRLSNADDAIREAALNELKAIRAKINEGTRKSDETIAPLP
jgi:hypothetical protein